MTEVNAVTAHLLMLDDDPEDAFLVQTALKRLDLDWSFQHFQTCQAFRDYLNTDYALQVQQSRLLLLLDLNMPTKTGWEWLQELRADHRFDELVIIVLSTSDMAEEQARSLALGANAHIGKPDSVNDLARWLKSLYGRWIDKKG
ncbi:Response regulator rcp1 [Marinomonas aquimarina]|uniref:Response regulator rcp1 n=1 Tax=Marinomonas aquimarina TaxID=295068 RepID=A0A1A8TS87_9GAMM|nr:response regulator [Marinomonas aquimarina]SBS35833.1 Response regulator rcp1 [Marinomonas aquimarina]